MAAPISVKRCAVPDCERRCTLTLPSQRVLSRALSTRSGVAKYERVNSALARGPARRDPGYRDVRERLGALQP